MMRPIVLAIATLLMLPAGLFAQSQPAPAAAAQASPAVDASKLGVSLSRIKRELAETEQPESDDPLRLRFRVEVVGTAPRIDFLEGFSVEGAVPYGPPTHAEVLDVLTPREFRSPVVPFYSIAKVAAQKLWQYNKKKQCEAELEEYRRLVMQGVAIAAPRCTQ